MIKTAEGILYPENEKIVISAPSIRKTPAEIIIRKVPHKERSLCKDELDRVFTELSEYSTRDIFFLAPLHGGPLVSDTDDEKTFYTYDTESISFENLEKNSGMCSEEFSLEILLPYLDALFKDSTVHAFYAPQTAELKAFASYIFKEFPSSIILISDNGNCCSMWKKALNLPSGV